MPSDTSYKPMRIAQGAPQVSGPGGPVRVDPQTAGAGYAALADFAAGGVKYLDSLQKAADLNDVAQRRSAWGKRMGEEWATFANSRQGSNPTEDMQKWGEISDKVKFETTRDATPGVQQALGQYFAQHEETYNGKAREAVYGAVKKNADNTMDASLADNVSLAMQTADNGQREQHMLKQLDFVDAQVEAGLLSPIDGAVRKTKDRQLFYVNLFRGDLLKENWKKAYDEWQQDKPVDSQGNTWKRLVGKDGIEALERMSQTIFAERTRESVRLAEKRETDAMRTWNASMQSETARLARTGTPEQWEAHRQRVLANPNASPEAIRGVESRPDPLDATPETRAAKDTVKGGYNEMTRKYDPDYRKKEQEDLQALQKRIREGANPVEAAQEVRKQRSLSLRPPAGFSGEPTQQNLAAYERAMLDRVARGELKQAQADRVITYARQWVENNQAKVKK